MKESTSRLSLYRGAVRAIELCGDPPERLLRAAGISAAAFGIPNARVSTLSARRFLELASETLDEPVFGLKAAVALEPDDLGRLGREITQALTLFGALRTFSRGAQDLFPASAFGIEQRNGASWFRHSYRPKMSAPSLVAQAQAEQFVLGVMIRVIQLTADPDWRPTEIQLQTPQPRDLENTPVLNGTEIHAERPVTALALPDSLLVAPVRGRAGTSAGQHREPAWLTALRGAIHEGLPRRTPPLGAAAALAGLTARTLQRRMAIEGLSYSGLVDQVRFDLTLQLFGDSNVTLSDIAKELGYAANSHFTRAFRRWTGVAPRDFRKRRPAQSA